MLQNLVNNLKYPNNLCFNIDTLEPLGLQTIYRIGKLQVNCKELFEPCNKFLDIGCSIGLFSFIHSLTAEKCVAVDSNAEQLNIMNAIIKYRKCNNIQLIHSNFSSLTQITDKFDTIWLGNSFHYFYHSNGKNSIQILENLCSNYIIIEAPFEISYLRSLRNNTIFEEPIMNDYILKNILALFSTNFDILYVRPSPTDEINRKLIVFKKKQIKIEEPIKEIIVEKIIEEVEDNTIVKIEDIKEISNVSIDNIDRKFLLESRPFTNLYSCKIDNKKYFLKLIYKFHENLPFNTVIKSYKNITLLKDEIKNSIVKVFDIQVKEDNILVLMEFLKDYTSFTKIKSLNLGFNYDNIIKLYVEELIYLVENNIFICDISTENIMFNIKKNIIKIIDIDCLLDLEDIKLQENILLRSWMLLQIDKLEEETSDKEVISLIKMLKQKVLNRI